MENNYQENQYLNQNFEKIDSFEKMDLSKELIKGLYSYGYLVPSYIQQIGVVPILKQKDVILQAQSGFGKTLTFCLPALKVVNININSPQVLILCNTRELSMNIWSVLKDIVKYTNIKVSYCVGGLSIQQNIEQFQQGIHVVIGTPGRVYDMIKRQYFQTENLKMLIIDEADEMLQLNFKNQIYDIYKCLPSCQIVLSSATLPKEVLNMANNFMTNPVKLLLQKSDNQIPSKIKQYYIHIEQDKWKYETLLDLYDNLTMAQTIIFCNTKERVEWLAQKMRKKQFQVSCSHGDLDMKERNYIFEEFKQGKTKVLISTDLLGRGIDFKDVRFVINFDIPNDRDQYIHRIGRSGRFGKKSAAISFVINEELWKIKDLEEYLKIEIKEMPANIDELI